MTALYSASGPDPLRSKGEAAIGKAVPAWWSGEMTAAEWHSALASAFPAIDSGAVKQAFAAPG
jgi:hypothetical protein